MLNEPVLALSSPQAACEIVLGSESESLNIRSSAFLQNPGCAAADTVDQYNLEFTTVARLGPCMKEIPQTETASYVLTSGKKRVNESERIRNTETVLLGTM